VRASPLSLNRHSGAGFECQPPDVSSVRFRRSAFSSQHSTVAHRPTRSSVILPLNTFQDLPVLKRVQLFRIQTASKRVGEVIWQRTPSLIIHRRQVDKSYIGVSVHKNGEKITSRKVRWHPPRPKHKLGIAPCSVSSLMVSVLQFLSYCNKRAFRRNSRNGGVTLLEV
jgi:hypothetical protein